MIDKDGFLRCSKCGRKIGFELEGRITLLCRHCKALKKYETAHTALFNKLKKDIPESMI